MRRRLKKCISLLLVCAVVCGCVSLCAAAAGTSIPTVYLYGYGEAIYADGTTYDSPLVYPAPIPEGFAQQVVKDIAAPFSKGLLLNRWDDFHQVIIDKVTDIFGGFALDENGEVANGSGNPLFIHTYPLENQLGADGKYELHAYRFAYDWRLDPYDAADELHAYIDAVKAATGSRKVNLIGRCLGSNVILAYMDAYGTDDVAQICFYAPGFNGFECIGALFAGKINLDADALADYLDNFGRDQIVGNGDNPTYDLLMALLQYLNAAKALGAGELLMNSYLIPEFNQYILPAVVRNTFGTLPACWSFIGDEYYDDAMQLIFGDYEEQYATLIEKANHYHEHVMKRTDELIETAIDKGVYVYIVAKYGSRMVSLLEESDLQSDGMTSTANSSHGATTAPLYGKLSDAYVKGVMAGNGGKYLSSDRQIDASTCLLPEHTWFIKYLYHPTNPDQVEQMIADLFDFDGYTTIWDFAQYPQFLEYDAHTGAISPLTQPPEETSRVWAIQSYFRALKRLLEALSRFIKSQQAA